MNILNSARNRISKETKRKMENSELFLIFRHKSYKDLKLSYFFYFNI